MNKILTVVLRFLGFFGKSVYFHAGAELAIANKASAKAALVWCKIILNSKDERLIKSTLHSIIKLCDKRLVNSKLKNIMYLLIEIYKVKTISSFGDNTFKRKLPKLKSIVKTFQYGLKSQL